MKDDVISRQAAIDAMLSDKVQITDTIRALGGERDFEVLNYTCDRHAEIIKDLPPVQPKQGKWIDTETSYADGVQQKCRCSVCARLSPRPLGDFCRWCGADMRGEEHE